jgi:hypothetical protein
MRIDGLVKADTVHSALSGYPSVSCIWFWQLSDVTEVRILVSLETCSVERKDVGASSVYIAFHAAYK